MKKNYEFVIGLDVSKDMLDYCIINQSTLHQDFGQLANTAKGIAASLPRIVFRSAQAEGDYAHRSLHLSRL